MGVPDDQMNFIVPISIKLKHHDESDTLNQLVNQMSDIDETQYGLSDYFPLDIKISQGNDINTAHIDFPEKANCWLKIHFFSIRWKKRFPITI
ncbi:hypothetical protein KEH51_25915 [[Brevibacterium] frigoritolerans]|uniref:Uncharacterized protein n=1 Tax=Peribacillus frigoritolerans TaxID=450367 RepID=A0A941FSY5_9BACI|nr:hypothetical protein [Peribacillus frigoritolerans]